VVKAKDDDDDDKTQQAKESSDTNLVACSQLEVNILSCNKRIHDTHHRQTHTAKIYKVEKTPRETQTLREGCSNAEPKIFTPPQTPFLGAQDGQNLISWRWSLPLPTNPVW